MRERITGLPEKLIVSTTSIGRCLLVARFSFGQEHCGLPDFFRRRRGERQRERIPGKIREVADSHFPDTGVTSAWVTRDIIYGT
jgi:hypothetical protein